jgi:adenosylmethionine-8-amino-7-oxononanoate aminotransferase
MFAAAGYFARSKWCTAERPKSRSPHHLKLHATIKKHAMTSGLICYPGGGTADGKAGDHALIAPPFNVTTADIEEIVPRLSSAVQTVLSYL